MTFSDKVYKQPELDLDRLIDQLKHNSDVFERADAAQALASHIDLRAVLALKDALKDQRPGVVKTTGSGRPIQLNLMNPSEMLRSDIDATIRKAIDNGASVVEINLIGRGSVQNNAASSLIQITSKLNDERAIEHLLKTLRDGDKYVTRVIFVSLCRLSAQTGNDMAIKDLIQVQPEIDKEMMGQPIVGSHKAADELILLLKELKKFNKPAPFIVCLESQDSDVLMFGVTTLLQMQEASTVIAALKNIEIKETIFNAILQRIEEMDSEVALTSLIELLKSGSPCIKTFAARKLRHSSDNRAVSVLLEWQSILEKALSGMAVTCHRCGRKPSQELQNNSYWCSWCGDSFTLEDVYASQANKSK